MRLPSGNGSRRFPTGSGWRVAAKEPLGSFLGPLLWAALPRLGVLRLLRCSEPKSGVNLDCGNRAPLPARKFPEPRKSGVPIPAKERRNLYWRFLRDSFRAAGTLRGLKGETPLPAKSKEFPTLKIQGEPSGIHIPKARNQDFGKFQSCRNWNARNRCRERPRRLWLRGAGFV